MKIFFPLFFILISHQFSLHAVHYEKLLDKMNKSFVKEVYKERKLRLAAYGGSMMKDIESVRLSFETQEKPSLDEARALYIEMTNNYLAKINENKSLKPYLHNYPFTIDNLNFSIFFLDKKNNWQTANVITLVSYFKRNRSVIYSTYDFEKKSLEDIYEEPYEEAVKLASSDTKVIK